MAVVTRHLPTAPTDMSLASIYELVDAIVETVDMGRDLDRLRLALDHVLDARSLFDAELRFNGLASSGMCFICEDIIGDGSFGGVAS